MPAFKKIFRQMFSRKQDFPGVVISHPPEEWIDSKARDFALIEELERRAGIREFLRRRGFVKREYRVKLLGLYPDLDWHGDFGKWKVILTIITSKKLRTTGNMFIVNLAIADLCVTTIVDPFSILGVLGGPQFFEDKTVLCHMVASVCLTSCMCSMWNIAGIAINRYVFLCRHYIYEDIYTWRKTLLICVGLWCICALLQMPNYLGWGGHTYDMKKMACSYDRMGDYTYIVFFCCVAVGLPLVAVLVSYLKIYLYVRKIRLEMQEISEQPSDFSEKRRNDEIKLAKTLFIVFVVFLVCWSPYAVVLLIDTFDEWPKIVYVVAIQMAHTNSSINSILYGVTNKSFRDGYKRVLLSLCCRIRKNDGLTSSNC